jgi:hypothetical protein
VLLATLILASAVAIRVSSELGRYGPQRAYPTAHVLKVDPNSAPGYVLESLPQVGPSLSNRILAERQVRPFTSLDDLRRRVRGLGPATLAKLSPHLTLEREAQPAVSSAPLTAIADATPIEGSTRKRRRPAVR